MYGCRWLSVTLMKMLCKCFCQNWHKLSQKSLKANGEMRSSYWWTEPHTIVALTQERVSITCECRWYWVRPIAMQRRQLRYGLLILKKVTLIQIISKRARGKGISYDLIFLVDILQILQGWCTSTPARYRQSKWGYFTGTSCYTCTTICVSSLCE